MGSSDAAAVAPPQVYLSEKWKLSKKDGGLMRSRSPPGGGSNSNSNSRAPLFSSSSSRQQQRCSFTRKCARLFKEQRARFYIMRRCVTMLICWNDCSDS